jgi:hypothetical protein
VGLNLKNIAKGIGKTAARIGKAAPNLIIKALNAQSGGALEMVADVLGIAGAPEDAILKHIERDPEASIDKLLELQQLRQTELEAIIKDRENARSMAGAMFQSHDPVLRWFYPFYTIILTAVCLYVFETLSVVERDKLSDTAIMLGGTFITLLGTVITFWFGDMKRQKDKGNGD